MNLKVKNEYVNNDILKNIKFYNKIISENFFIKSNNCEVLVVLIKGELKVLYENNELIIKRESVFREKPYAVYIPNEKEVKLIPIGETEIAICETEASKKGEIYVIMPDKVKEQNRGRQGFRRKVYDILDSNGPSEKLVVGETINYEGEWSSYPPHKHDENRCNEVKMEELYFFKLQPENGFGFQRIYTEDGIIDETMTIENNDIILIPKGYHPVSVMPGYEIYYLWVLVGENKVLMPYTQDKYRCLLKE